MRVRLSTEFLWHALLAEMLERVGVMDGIAYFRRMFRLSLSASTTLYSMISFSSAGPTT
jgi:hypothetical protein